MSGFKVTRLAALLAVLLVIGTASVAVGVTNSNVGDPLIIGNTTQTAGTKNTALSTNSTGNAFKMQNNGSGSGLRGVATGSGNGGSFTSTGSGNGVYSENTTAFLGTGVWALSTGSSGTGSFAEADNGTNAWGSAGFSSDGLGVYGNTNDGTGVYGYSTGTTDDFGHAAGWFQTTDGFYGTYGESSGSDGNGVTGVVTASATGLPYGIWGQDNSGLGYAGFFDGDLGLTGTCFGCTLGSLALNGSAAALHQGDAVTVIGFRAPVLGRTPVLVVAPARVGQPVIGIVDRAMVVRTIKGSGHAFSPSAKPNLPDVKVPPAASRTVTKRALQATGRTAVPGAYLSIITHGAFAYASVEVSAGPIRAGASLAAGSTAGRLVSAPTITTGKYSYAVPGMSVGYAIGHLDRGTGIIAIFVSPH